MRCYSIHLYLCLRKWIVGSHARQIGDTETTIQLWDDMRLAITKATTAYFKSCFWHAAAEIPNLIRFETVRSSQISHTMMLLLTQHKRISYAVYTNLQELSHKTDRWLLPDSWTQLESNIGCPLLLWRTRRGPRWRKGWELPTSTSPFCMLAIVHEH